jgi:hypothetical protein
MKATIEQYRPNYVSGYENNKNTFKSIQELLNIDWVSNFKSDKFYQFSMCHKSFHGDQNTLIAEYNNGEEWYVVGFINETDLINELPIFDKD